MSGNGIDQTSECHRWMYRKAAPANGAARGVHRRHAEIETFALREQKKIESRLFDDYIG